jgi:hypothetical protein
MSKLVQEQVDFDSWHKGEMKKYGIILFRMSVAPLMNLVDRLIKPENWHGATFLEHQAVTGGLLDLEFETDLSVPAKVIKTEKKTP